MPIEGNSILIAQGGFEPQRTNNWIVQINGGDNIGLASSDFYLSLKSFPFPVEQNPVKRIRWYNESRTYAGSLGDFADLSMQIHDYLDRNTAEIIYEWRRKIWNPANLTIGLARNYKLTGMLYLAPPNAISLNDIIAKARTWYLQGIWPISLDMGTFDMDGDGENVMINCSLAVDRAYPGGADGTSDPTKAGPQPIDITNI
jgi:hypothetical protein